MGTFVGANWTRRGRCWFSVGADLDGEEAVAIGLTMGGEEIRVFQHFSWRLGPPKACYREETVEL